jgi:RND family efflux transporter MFP subunit
MPAYRGLRSLRIIEPSWKSDSGFNAIPASMRFRLQCDSGFNAIPASMRFRLQCLEASIAAEFALPDSNYYPFTSYFYKIISFSPAKICSTSHCTIMSQDQASDLSSLKISREAATVRYSSKRRQKKRIIIYCCLGAFVLIVLMAFGGVFASAPTVETTTVTRISPTQSKQILIGSGYVVAQRKASVASKGTGRLVELNVVEGQVVHKNDILARIESSDMEAAIAQARAGIEQARAGLKQAEAEQVDAKTAFERAKNLLAVGSIAQAEFDMADARAKRAVAAVSAAQASIKAGEAALKAAEIQLENTRIRAPFDGTVLTKNADIGEVVAPFAASLGSKGNVVTMADMSSLEVEVDVSESNIERIYAGQPCEITLDAYPDRRYRGVVSKIVPTADRTKATVQTKVRFSDLDERVLPEMGSKVAFLAQDIDQSKIAAPMKTAVSTSSIINIDGKNYAFIVKDNALVRREVQTGDAAGAMIEIVSGLEPGDVVVAVPKSDLKDGMKVNPVVAGK